jgi:WbqC-like protein family
MILLSTAYFPPVSYFKELIQQKSIQIETQETYQKQTFRNRCNIYSANGKLPLVFPVIKPNGNHSKINEIKLSEQENFGLKHWRAIKSAYNASPFLMYYEDDLAPLFEPETKLLLDHNMRILHTLFELLELDIEISFTSDFQKSPVNTNDLRTTFNPKKNGTGSGFKTYTQVFESKFGFIEDLSILDALFNLGPETVAYLKLA